MQQKIRELQYVLRRADIHPRKYLGQHFLLDEHVLEPMLDAAKLSQNDTVLEIGPGLGILTKELAERAGKICAVEKDQKLSDLLRTRFHGRENVTIVHQNVLFFDPSLLGPYKLVANLPYNITSPVIRKFIIEEQHRPLLTVLMVQKEMAERLTAPPGSSERGILTVFVEAAASAKVIKTISKTAFWPVPKVDSAILAIENIAGSISRSLTQIIKAGFSQKRRKLINSLSGGLRLKRQDVETLLECAGILPNLRAEDLSISQWKELERCFTLKSE